MDTLETLGVLALGILIRFAIPIGVTALLVWFFRRIDQRWKAEARLTMERALPKNPGCWKINNCSAVDRAKCLAYANPDKPCWYIFRGKEGLLQEKCLICDIFRKAPIPIFT